MPLTRLQSIDVEGRKFGICQFKHTRTQQRGIMVKAWLSVSTGPIQSLVIAAVVSVLLPVAGIDSANAANRGFELVSPPYKGGFGVSHIEAVAQDGEAVAFFSPGVFAGAPSGFTGNLNDVASYLARRNESGWHTSAFMPPVTLLAKILARDVTPELDWTLALGKPGVNSEEALVEGRVNEFFIHNYEQSDFDWTPFEPSIEEVSHGVLDANYWGASADLCHIVILDGSGVLLASAHGSYQQAYEFVRGCNGEPRELRLISVNSNGQMISPSCPVDIGTELYNDQQRSAFNTIAAAGHEIFFTSCIEDNDAHHQLFVRLDGIATLEVSKPLEKCVIVPCVGALERPSADFAGASEDGTKVYFTTSAPLTGNGTDKSSNLFLAQIGCPEQEERCNIAHRKVRSLTQVSYDPNASGQAEVQGVVKVAPDGSHVYFVSHGDLLSEASRETLKHEGREVPVTGAENLYEYAQSEEHVKFVAALCSGLELSGKIVDPRCPSAESDKQLWSGTNSESQTNAGDGRFLLFSSYGQLTPDDADTSKDVYRYDAASDALTRVSIGQQGYAADGNAGNIDAEIPIDEHYEAWVREQQQMADRAISEDGQTVIFASSEALSPAAVNGVQDVYEWHAETGGGGAVSMVSGGGSTSPITDYLLDRQGRNVFFVTSERLAIEDTDAAPDLYDARIGAARVEGPVAREPCSSDACQGPLTSPAPIVIPATVTQDPGEDAFPAKGKAKRTKKVKKARKRAKQVRARHATHRRVALKAGRTR